MKKLFNWKYNMNKVVLFIVALFLIFTKLHSQVEELFLSNNSPINCLLIDNPFIYVGTTDYGSFIHNTTNGNLLQNNSISSRTNYFVKYDSLIFSLNSVNGVEIFKQSKKYNEIHNSLNPYNFKVIDVNSSYIIYGSYGMGVYIYDKKTGKTYPKNSGFNYPEITNFSIYQDSSLIATTHHGGFYVSKLDTMSKWDQFNAGIESTILNLMTSDNQNIVVVSGKNTIYYTTDNGQSWKKIDFPYSSEIVIAIKIENGTLYLGTKSGNLYSSSDLGKNWEENNTLDKGISITAIDVKDNAIVIGTEENGIYYSSDNGQSWKSFPIKNKYSSLYFSNLYTQNNIIYAAEYYQGILYSTNNGNKWIRTKFYETSTDIFIKDITVKDSLIFVSTENKGLFLSCDKGMTWNKANTGLSALETEDFTWIQDTLFVATINGIFASTDKGKNWLPRNNGLQTNGFKKIFYNNGRLFISNYGTGKWHVYYSDDNGFKWTILEGIQYKSPLCIKASGDHLYISTDYKNLFISSDNGNTWKELILQGLANDLLAKDSILIVPEQKKGIGISTNYGFTYRKILEFNNNYDNDIKFLEYDSEYIYCASQKKLYRIKWEVLLMTGVDDNGKEFNEPEFKIYPNPASNILIVSNNSEITIGAIEIYDYLGNLVLKYENKNENKIQLNLSSLTSGIYLIKLNNSSQLFIKE